MSLIRWTVTFLSRGVAFALSFLISGIEFLQERVTSFLLIICLFRGVIQMSLALDR